MNPQELNHQMKLLVELALPEFGTSENNEIRVKKSKRSVNYIRRRSDGLFERLFVECDSRKVPVLIGTQFAASLFIECPIPSGPFGYDAGLFDKGLQRFYWGAGWYMVPDDEDENGIFMRLMRQAFQEIVRPAMDKWAQQLKDDLVAMRMAETYEKLAVGDPDGAEKALRRSVAGLGNFSSRGYPVEKMVRQLTLRLQRNKNWHLF